MVYSPSNIGKSSFRTSRKENLDGQISYFFHDIVIFHISTI